jgi:hypothetical protein
MWFQVDDFRQPDHPDAIARALRRRDPAAIVRPEGRGVRVVACLDLRRMLEAFREAGVDAVPDFRIAHFGAEC